MATSLISLDDFSGGEISRGRPFNRPNERKGLNCWIYPSGGIGPRPPVQDSRITGFPNGTLGTFQLLRGTTGLTKLIFTVGVAVYRSDAAFGVALSSLGNSANAAVDSCSYGDTGMFVASAGAGFSVTTSAGPTAVATMPNGTLIAPFNKQFVVVNSTATGAIQWSGFDSTSFVTAGSGNVVIGSGFLPILALLSQRNQLVIPKWNGDVWVLSGVLGANETLRQVDQGLLARTKNVAKAAVVNGSNAWWTAGRDMVRFSGSQLLTQPRPALPVISGFATESFQDNAGHVTELVEDDEFVLVGCVDDTSTSSNTKAIFMQAFRPSKDNWSNHFIPNTTYEDPAASPDTTNSGIITANTLRTQSFLGTVNIAVTGNAAESTPLKMLVWNAHQEFPYLTVGKADSLNRTSDSLNDGLSGLPVTATLQTSDYWAPDSASLCVRAVNIDYSYDPSVLPHSTYNKFGISVTALKREGFSGNPEITSQVINFVADGLGTTMGSGSGATIRNSTTFNFGDQGSGEGWRVNLSNWRGIVIHRINVTFDEQPRRF